MTTAKEGDRVKVAGLVIVKQRQRTVNGICFMTIEDEASFANVVIFEDLFKKYRKEVVQSKLIMVEGKLQIEGEVIHVIAERCYDFSNYSGILLQLMMMLFPGRGASDKFVPTANKFYSKIVRSTDNVFKLPNSGM